MTTYPLAHLVKQPAKPYVHSTATDIRKTLDEARARLAAEAAQPAGRKVATLKKRGA